MKKHTVTFLPDKVKVTVEAGTTLMAAAAEAGVEFEGPCGGRGVCGKCRMRILEGGAPGWVLACQTAIHGDLVVEIPQQEIYLSRKTALTLGELAVEIDPGLNKRKVRVQPPSIEHQVSDATRLLTALGEPAVLKLGVLRALPSVLREAQHQVTLIMKGTEVIALEPGDTEEEPLYGLAVDMGTTTVVGTLVDLKTGKNVAAASAGNTQNIFGADVISRIQHAARGSRELEQLRRRVVQVINRLADKLAQVAGISTTAIYQASIVGNTTMHHLFLGLDPRHLAPAPFIPVVTDLVTVEAGEIGLHLCPHAPVYLLPNVAGYVGADTVGVILSTGLDEVDRCVLAVDVGTNGEIVLALPGGRLLTCSTAAGPAFEGAQIKCGMRAQAGAIEKVKIEADRIRYEVIGDVPPRGICGSGLMDAISEMYRAGVIEANGRITPPEKAGHLPAFLQSRIRGRGAEARFVLATPEETGGPEVYLTQKDVRELQLAKGAIRAGIEVLLQKAGISSGELEEILLAGAFGSYIDKQSALGIGLLPQVDPGKIRAVGNAAGAGAILALLSQRARRRAASVARQCEHLELSTVPEFQEAFIKHLNFA